MLYCEHLNKQRRSNKMSKQVSETAIRLCYLPNSKVQVFSTKTRRISKFQIQTLLEISQHPNFDHFVIDRDQVYSPCKSGVIYAHVYDRLGKSIITYISKTEILGVSESAARKAPFHPEVYAVRCNP